LLSGEKLAEAKEQGNLELTQKLYYKASRFLFSFGAIVAVLRVCGYDDVVDALGCRCFPPRGQEFYVQGF
jgi:hypothetical protein